MTLIIEMQHPITPPPELVQQWLKERTLLKSQPLAHTYLATRAAQWGADQELEACCEWLEQQTLCGHQDLLPSFRSRRRPKPPSLKEQGIKSLDNVIDCIKSLVPGASVDGEDIKVIRRALEELSE